jgi:predicted metalloprotease with PDZ domain
MSVRTNWVDEEFALLNGAPTYITLVEPPATRPHEVHLQLPPSWQRSFSGMSQGKSPNSFVAPDYDTLVDSPILAGTPEVHEFQVSGTPHYLVDFRGRGVWKGAVAVAELAKVAQTIARFWGNVPFERYYFFNIAGASLNGLEHKNSTVINIPRESTDTREGLIEWLSMASHEYFHAWNVKRLRPIELGPFDYENEVYTRGLWFVEGVTDYYADLLLARAGVVSRDEFLTLLSAQIRRLQTTPGRLEQSVEMASFDAWIKYYRPDENSANSSINYYVKGAVIGFVLDANLRRMTAGERSLDDVMRRMYERFSGAKGFTSEEVRAAVVAAAGTAHSAEMRAWLERALTSTEEIDYADALQWLGLQLTSSSEPPRAWMGLVTRAEESRTVVSEVRRGSPAFVAGISIGDVIADIDGQPLRGPLDAAINRFRPGDAITVALSRDSRVLSVPVTLAADPSQAWTLSVPATATPEQTRRLGEWIGGQ